MSTALTDNQSRKHQLNRVKWVSVGVLVAFLIFIFTPTVYIAIWIRPFDYPEQLYWTEGLANGGELHLGGVLIDNVHYRPNLLFPVFVVGVSFLSGLDFPKAALIVSTLAFVATGLLTYLLLWQVLPKRNPRRTGILAFELTLVLSLVGPITLFTWPQRNLYFGYIIPQLYHNATFTLAKPFVLLQFLAAVRSFDPKFIGRNNRWLILGAAIATVLSTHAKPNYTLCLLPVMCLLLALQLFRRQPVDWRLALFGIIIPSLIILGAQYQFTFNSDEANQISFAPFVPFVMRNIRLIPLKFVMSILFPASVTLIYWRQTSRDVPMIIGWSSFAVSAILFYFFVEEKSLRHMNFQWGCHLTLFILFIVATYFLIRQIVDYKAHGWRVKLPSAILAAHFICGFVWYAIDGIVRPHLMW